MAETEVSWLKNFWSLSDSWLALFSFSVSSRISCEVGYAVLEFWLAQEGSNYDDSVNYVED
jgi:hypothetical protein